MQDFGHVLFVAGNGYSLRVLEENMCHSQIMVADEQ